MTISVTATTALRLLITANVDISDLYIVNMDISHFPESQYTRCLENSGKKELVKFTVAEIF